MDQSRVSSRFLVSDLRARFLNVKVALHFGRREAGYGAKLQGIYWSHFEYKRVGRMRFNDIGLSVC